MKIFKKAICFILTLGLVAGVLTGCSDSGALDDDDTVMTVNGQDVRFDLYKYWLVWASSYYEYLYDSLDWEKEVASQINEDETVTITEAVKEIADEMCVNYLVMEQYADELGVEISEDDIAGYEETIRSQYDSDEELVSSLEQNGTTLEVVKYQYKVADMYSRSFAETFGENGELVADENVAQFVEDNNYVQAKHILFSTLDDDQNALDEAAVAEKRATADSVAAMLGAYEGDDISSYFDELMAEYNEDPGTESNPDGYLFTSGNMVTEFEDAAFALGENEFSEVVESTYGYHIILRLPVDFDAVPLYTGSSSSSSATLRAMVASQTFDDKISELMDEAVVEHTSLYEKIVPQDIYEEVQAKLDEGDDDEQQTDQEVSPSDANQTDLDTGTADADAADSDADAADSDADAADSDADATDSDADATDSDAVAS